MRETQERSNVFPDGPEDGDVMFRGEIVCEYHKNTNTWECWRHSKGDYNG